MKNCRAFVFLALFFLIVNIYSVKAIINETQQVDKAYAWLENKTRNNWQNLKVLQHEFSLLALAYNENLKAQGLNILKARGYPAGNPYCWGREVGSINNENQCKIKETAIASFIYNEFGLNYSKINEWLLNNSALFKDISWFLQADVERGFTANCTIEYENTILNFSIDKDKNITLISTPPTSPCFDTFNNKWLKIRKECYEKNFKITCNVEDNKPYTLTFLYKKSENDLTWYVAETFSIGSGETYDVSIKEFSICLGDLEGCEYEANAIAAYVLFFEGDERYKNMLPFLILNAEDNKNKNSYAWLYLITSQSEYSEKVLKAKQQQGFWKLSNFGQFYDTSINAYSLKKESIDFNETKTKNYLLQNQKQEGFWKCGESGCEEIRDTALILYVFWPKGITPPGGPGVPGLNDCEAQGGSCEIACNIYNNFVEYPSLNYACGNLVCCMNALSLSCNEIGGEICDENETCINGYNLTTREGGCCVNGTCQASEKTCQEQGGYVCDGINEFCPSGKEIPASDLSGEEECCSVECRSCQELGGKECESDEVCDGNEKGGCCFGECIPEDCEAINAELCDKAGWGCDGTFKKSGEGMCCVGDCIKECNEEGGIVCEEKEVCSGQVVKAKGLTAKQICCIGECKKKKGFPAILLIILLIIIIALLLFFLYKKGVIKFKKKEKPKKPEIFKPEEKIERPLTRIERPTTLPPIAPRPIPRPLPTLKPEVKEVKEEKKEVKERKKSKSEEELEKTLKKIRELTK
jgi:hypothetical protein